MSVKVGLSLRDCLLLSLQRFHCAWKQDIHHWTGVRSWQWHTLHLPRGKPQTDSGRLRPWLQHVICCPWKPHQKPLPIFPHKGEISMILFCHWESVSLLAYVCACVFFFPCMVKTLGLWPNTSKLANMSGWIISQRDLPWAWHIFICA